MSRTVGLVDPYHYYYHYPTPQAIQVAIQFEPSRWLKLGFRSRGQAERYANRIRHTWIHHNCRLDSRIDGTWVIIRLPSCVFEIVSSASCPGAAGFYFRFDNDLLARRWEEGLLCFRYFQDSRSLYVKRNISDRELFR